MIKKILNFLFVTVLHLKIKDDVLDKWVQFIEFGIVGISNTVISYIVYATLVVFGMNYIVASIISYFASVINAFYWNNKYVFNQEKRSGVVMVKAFIKTIISYAGTGLVLHNILMVIWVDVLNIHELLAPIINLCITVPLNFILNKFWTFKDGK